jgi:hypothetical protein
MAAAAEHTAEGDRHTFSLSSSAVALLLLLLLLSC